MTLFRKGLIKWYSHAFWYTLALIMAWTLFLTHMRTAYYMTLMCCCFYMRVNFGLSKYIIWFSYGLVSLPSVEKYIWTHVDQQTDLLWSVVKQNNVPTYDLESISYVRYAYIYLIGACVVLTLNKVQACLRGPSKVRAAEKAKAE